MMPIWKFQAHLNRIAKNPVEFARFCGLSIAEQDIEINAYWSA